MNQDNFIKSGIFKVSAGSDVSRRKKTFARNRKNHSTGSVALKTAEKKGKKEAKNNQKIDVSI
jgi:hypothetical protein